MAENACGTVVDDVVAAAFQPAVDDELRTSKADEEKASRLNKPGDLDPFSSFRKYPRLWNSKPGKLMRRIPDDFEEFPLANSS